MAIGVWEKHEDLALLRSGFSLRFNEQELQAVDNVSTRCMNDSIRRIAKASVCKIHGESDCFDSFAWPLSETPDSSANHTTLSQANTTTRDLDEALGLRRDLRHLKVFTIDSAETSEIDDGLSLEKYIDKDGSEKQRIWVHIADAERWAPRESELYDIARRRVTSLYLPHGPIPMLPRQ